MSISLRGKKEEVRKYREFVQKAAEATLSFLQAEGKSLSILLTDDEEMRRLNREFRNVDSTTDVLSFPYGEGNSSYLGDIAISLPRTEKQAKEYGEKFEDELSRLVIHGILHLLGERDETSKARRRMWDKQEKILRLVKKNLGG